ncbi:MAG: hypothetical protein ACFFCW_42715 [Candidatus Hodarchaeota archaeon]
MEKPWANWPKGVSHTIDYPNVALFALLDETARNYPDHVALIFQDKKLTYRALKNQADRVTTGLEGGEVK